MPPRDLEVSSWPLRDGRATGYSRMQGALHLSWTPGWVSPIAAWLPSPQALVFWSPHCQLLVAAVGTLRAQQSFLFSVCRNLWKVLGESYITPLPMLALPPLPTPCLAALGCGEASQAVACVTHVRGCQLPPSKVSPNRGVQFCGFSHIEPQTSP